MAAPRGGAGSLPNPDPVGGIRSASLFLASPVASIRERVYAVPNVGYGILLFAAGGFVEAGRRIARLVRIAQEMATICSNDPVCGQNGAACNACLRMAGMACEQGNIFLDRALVVSLGAATVAGTETGFFTEQA